MKEYILCIILGIILYFIIQDSINDFSVGVPYQIWTRRYKYNEDLSTPEYKVYNRNIYNRYNEELHLLSYGDDIVDLDDYTNTDNLNFYVQEVYDDGIPVFPIGRGNRGVTGNYPGDYYNVLLPARVYTENQNIRNIFDDTEDAQQYPVLRLDGEEYYILNQPLTDLNRDDFGIPLANAYLWQQFWIDVLTRYNIPNLGDNILLYNLTEGIREIVEEPEDIAPAPGITPAPEPEIMPAQFGTNPLPNVIRPVPLVQHPGGIALPQPQTQPQTQPRPQQIQLTGWQRFRQCATRLMQHQHI